jgi:hypothetical protein
LPYRLPSHMQPGTILLCTNDVSIFITMRLGTLLQIVRFAFCKPVFAFSVSIFLIIFNPNISSAKPNSLPVVLDSAITHDANGNGYLDEIALYFSGPAAFPAVFSPSDFTIYYSGTINGQVVKVPFLVTSVNPMDTTETRFVLILTENTSTISGTPQTAWRPYLSILDSVFYTPLMQCRDGTGPVIWNVLKTIMNVSDRKQDVVQITFSEPIQGANGMQFAPGAVKPENVLFAYRKNSSNGWDTLNVLSSGLSVNGTNPMAINSFSRMVNDSTLEFIMSNGKDLTSDDYLNINAVSNQIFDSRSRTGGGPGVSPEKNNQKVQVRVFNNSMPQEVTIIPSPTKPILVREKPGEFYVRDNPNARNWVRMDQAGIVFTFDLSPDPAGINTTIKIFDVYNSITVSASGVLGISDSTNSLSQTDIYWNGTTSNGEFVHEGLYSVQVQLSSSHQSSPTILQGSFYLTKPDTGHSTCGGNYSIAFLPAIWLKTRKPLLNSIKKLLKKSKQPC